MELEKSVDELVLQFKIIASGFWKPNTRWKGSSNGV